MNKLAEYGQGLFLLTMRLYWGWAFFMAGKGKFGDINKVIAFFTELHIPYPHYNAYLVATVEMVGGLLLLAGLFSRLVAIPLVINMTVAYLTAHIESVRNICHDPETFLKQAPFLFLLTSLIILLFGPGLFSIDRIIKNRVRRKTV